MYQNHIEIRVYGSNIIPYKLPKYLPMRLFYLEDTRQIINSDGIKFLAVVGSRGPDPGSEVKVFQQTPILLALSVVTCLRRPKSHLKQYGRVLEPGFRTLRESR